MIFPGFPGVLSFFQVFQVEWEPCSLVLCPFSLHYSDDNTKNAFNNNGNNGHELKNVNISLEKITYRGVTFRHFHKF